MDPYMHEKPGVLDAALCQELIEAFNRDARVQPDPQEDYSRRTYLYLSDKPDWLPLLQRVQAKADELVGTYFQQFTQKAYAGQSDWFDDGYVLAKYKPGDICILHDDGQNPEPPHNGYRLLTVLFYLNTVAEGGETYFPYQSLAVKPERGKALLFPASFTHPHEVLATKSEDRYIMQTWVTDPDMVVNWRKNWDHD